MEGFEKVISIKLHFIGPFAIEFGPVQYPGAKLIAYPHVAKHDDRFQIRYEFENTEHGEWYAQEIEQLLATYTDVHQTTIETIEGVVLFTIPFSLLWGV